MKTPFERMMESLGEARDVIAHAQSDAAFDGRDWDGLSNADKHRYIQRVCVGYKAVAKAIAACSAPPTPSQPSQERT